VNLKAGSQGRLQNAACSCFPAIGLLCLVSGREGWRTDPAGDGFAALQGSVRAPTNTPYMWACGQDLSGVNLK
jgi:hypothetical protein